MGRKFFGQLLLGALLTSGIADSGATEESKKYAMMGQATWSAFVCAALASKIGDAVAHERLFTYGYETGRKFIEAAESEKMQREDVSSEVPMIVLLLLEGPTHDFMLGRIYETAVDDALEDVYGDDEIHHSEETQRILANTKFVNANCGLIGDSS